MSDAHPCFMPTCERIAHSQWAVCGSCYRVLPVAMRTAISRAFTPAMTRDDMSPGMRRAINESHAWILETFGEPDREKYDPGKWERLKRYVRDRDEARAARRAAAAAESKPDGEKSALERAPHLRLVP